METFRSAHKTNRTPAEHRDYIVFVTLTQIFCCAFVFLLLLLLSRGDSARAQGLRQDYALLLSRELQMKDIGEAVGAVRDFFLPQEGTAAVMAQPAEESTTPQREDRPQNTTEQDQATEPAPQSDETTKQSPDPVPQTEGAAQSQATKALSVGAASAAKAEKTVVSLSPSSVAVPITRPVEGGRYSSYYGYRNNPITHRYSFHGGLDIAVAYGTKIRAAYGGKVRQVGEDSRSGKYLTIAHDDGCETFYCHCSEILVADGTVVRAGEAVACVGSTGWSTGPHLHFEIRRNGAKIDPLTVLEHDV